MKAIKTIAVILVSLLLIGIIILFEVKNWPVGSSLAGVFLGLSLPKLLQLFQDLSDTTTWKASQRKLKREGTITDDTLVRISFAYLYRIKLGNQYFLVKNARGTEKYQPVGGVYKLKMSEKLELKKRFHVVDDDKIAIDESSRDDYRLQLKNRYLRKFVKRFNRGADRERIDNLSREFREELIDSGILDWKQITYRFCGRHMTELHYSEHFQIYEILLADIVELIPTVDQEVDLRKLAEIPSPLYRFATAKEIKSLGVNTSAGLLLENISDHTSKILQENEPNLISVYNCNRTYTVDLV